MLKAGVTGGIGSGKSVVCQVFHTLGIPVFNSDTVARYLMESDPTLIGQIKSLLGENAYVSGKLNRTGIATTVFNDPQKLQQLNALVHPATIRYSQQWLEKQSAPYAIKEAAIFFESGSNAQMDIMVGVFAPRELRIKRAMTRGAITRERVIEIMAGQMDEEEKMKRCDHIIINDDVTPILPQVLRLHELFLLQNAAGK